MLLPFPFSADRGAVVLVDADFAEGGLRVTSYARPSKLFTANATLVRSIAGRLHEAPHQQVCEALVALLRAGDSPEPAVPVA